MSVQNFRGIVQTQFKIPIESINRVKDADTRNSLLSLKRIIDDVITEFSAQINDKMTNRRGDTFSGTMNFTSPGILILPIYAVDPSSLTDGEVWYNSTSKTFKCRQSGATKTFTVS